MKIRFWIFWHAVLMLAGTVGGLLTNSHIPIMSIAGVSFLWYILLNANELSVIKPWGGYANWVTGLRLLFLIIYAAFFSKLEEPIQALILATIISMDLLDGYLAKRLNIKTTFGAVFDLETDAILVLLLSVMHFQFGRIGLWIVVVGLLRYLFVVFTRILGWGKREEKRTQFGPLIGAIIFLSMVTPFLFSKQIYMPIIAVASFLVFVSFSYSFILLARSSE